MTFSKDYTATIVFACFSTLIIIAIVSLIVVLLLRKKNNRTTKQETPTTITSHTQTIFVEQPTQISNEELKLIVNYRKLNSTSKEIISQIINILSTPTNKSDD